MSPQEAVLTYESRERAPIVQRRALDATRWNKVTSALDPEGLRALPDVVGCPDCADGGAESVAVAFVDGQVDKVTFEYNRDVPGVDALADALREIRDDVRSSPVPRRLPIAPRKGTARSRKEFCGGRQGRSSTPNETRPWE